MADIGTDHGLLPIKLALDGKVKNAIAMDLREGPLSRAREQIKSFGLEERIQTRLSDGMSELQNNEVDSIVIAGLGGELMIDILDARRDLHKKEFVLSPHSDWKLVRRYLREQNFCLVDEDMIQDEKNKYYIFLKVRGRNPNSGMFPGKSDGIGFEQKDFEDGETEQEVGVQKELIKKKAKQKKSEQDALLLEKYEQNKNRTGREECRFINNAFGRYDYFGEILIKKKHPILLSYLEKEEEKYKEILLNLQTKNLDEGGQFRIREIHHYLDMIKQSWGEMI